VALCTVAHLHRRPVADESPLAKSGGTMPPRIHAPVVLTVLLSLASLVGALRAEPPSKADEYRAGRSFIPTRVYSADDDAVVLKAFEGLRVADVTDGMDFVGLKNVGLMDPGILPLWKDAKDYRHRFIGIAVTVRYVPTQRPPAPAGLSYEAFRAGGGKWYN